MKFYYNKLFIFVMVFVAVILVFPWIFGAYIVYLGWMVRILAGLS